MGYITKVLVVEGKWILGDAIFATHEEAAAYTQALANVWISVIDTAIIETPQAPTHRFTASGKVIPVGAPEDDGRKS
jgi:hypothetical protein